MSGSDGHIVGRSSTARTGCGRRSALVLLAATLIAGVAPGAEDALLASFVSDRGAPIAAGPAAQPLMLLSFGYTSCPDVCPLTLLALHQALEQLGPSADRVAVYFITVDPERDTVQRLHQYVSSFDDRIRGLRGSDAALRVLTQRLHVQYWREALYSGSADYAMSHTATLFLLDAHHHLLARIQHDDRADVLAGAVVHAIRNVRSP